MDAPLLQQLENLNFDHSRYHNKDSVGGAFVIMQNERKSINEGEHHSFALEIGYFLPALFPCLREGSDQRRPPRCSQLISIMTNCKL